MDEREEEDYNEEDDDNYYEYDECNYNKNINLRGSNYSKKSTGTNYKINSSMFGVKLCNQSTLSYLRALSEALL